MSRTKVDYSDRPSKGLVRYRINNIIEEVYQPHQNSTSNLSYITFSGFRFIDSIEFYNRFNIRNIFSIEYKEPLFRRACFNRPYEFIEIIKGRVSDFIDNRYHSIRSTNKIIHLDYEFMLRDEIIADIENLFATGFFNEETLLFMTFNRSFNNNKLTPIIKEIIPNEIKTKEAYENWLNDSFSYLILNKIQEKYKETKLLHEKLKIFYKDTADMVVFGYLIKDRKESDPVIINSQLELIALPVLTFLEKNYIRNHLQDEVGDIANKLGLSETDIKNFKKYI